MLSKKVYLTPGAHDISIKWDGTLNVHDFLLYYQKIRDNKDIMETITDIETSFMWRLLDRDETAEEI